jgi:hypothetical protein
VPRIPGHELLTGDSLSGPYRTRTCEPLRVMQKRRIQRRPRGRSASSELDVWLTGVQFARPVRLGADLVEGVGRVVDREASESGEPGPLGQPSGCVLVHPEGAESCAVGFAHSGAEAGEHARSVQ